MRALEANGAALGRSRVWSLRTRDLPLTPPVLMGIMNLTPDSFSDGGALPDLSTQLARARSLIDAGAGILDVGGESTRPGAAEVPVEEEIRRVIPFIRAVAAEMETPISIDTRKAAVAEAALEAGAEVVNDISGLLFDPAMGSVVARSGAGLVLMHMRGTPFDMAQRAAYEDVVVEVRAELSRSLALAAEAGVESQRIVLDPGIGFAKSAEQSIALLAGLSGLAELGFPLMVGPSRKSFIGVLSNAPVDGRIPGTLAACVMAFERGASLFRIHDVAEASQALAVAHAVTQAVTRSMPVPSRRPTR